MPLSKALKTSATLPELAGSVAATLGFGVVRRAAGWVVADGCTSVLFCESAEDRFVLVVGAVVRGRTVGEELVFWAKALTVDIAKTRRTLISNLLAMSYSSYFEFGFVLCDFFYGTGRSLSLVVATRSVS